MILLDTDHLTALRYPELGTHRRLVEKMRASSDQEFMIPVIAVEEQLRGWLAVIRRGGDHQRLIAAYDRLGGLIEIFGRWEIVRFGGDAAEEYERLRSKRLRIGTMDMRIASIALATQATLLTANVRHFEQVPGLRFENWLE